MTNRTELARAIRNREVVFAPLCLDALTARIAAGCGLTAGYLSGGALGYANAVSEALLTVTELADVARRITLRADIALVVDVGVGFGDPVHVARTVWEMEQAGAAAIELEDQVAPKRVSHHRGIEHLVNVDMMMAKIAAAVDARQDEDMLIIARTGAVKNESFAAAVDRAQAYVSAGADVIMLAPQTDEEWRAASQRINAPLAAITSLDRFSADEWAEFGFSLIADPFTAQVLAMIATRSAYESFARTGRTGTDPRAVMAAYRDLPGLAGLDALYAIEDETTER